MTDGRAHHSGRMGPDGPAIRDIDYNQLDHQKVVFYGIGLFSGITMALFPLSVIKTQQMSSPTAYPGFSGAVQVARTIHERDGMRGFYRGFGTVVAGAIPARMLYLPTYEATRTRLRTELESRFGDQLPHTLISSVCNGVGGACGSVASSAVVVPMDVVSSRLMVQYRGAGAAAEASASQGTTSAEASAAAKSAGAASSRSAPAARTVVSPQPLAAAGRGAGGAHDGTGGHNGHGGSNGQGGARSLHTSAAHQRIWQSSSGAQHGAERRVLQHGAGSILAGTRRMGATGGGGGPGKAAPAQVDLSRVGGIGMTRHILRNEGVRGLYRGLGMSLITYTPSSAAWWSFYAVYQDWSWYFLYHQGANIAEDNRTAIAAVQAFSGCLAGFSSGALTTPLDVIKTQLQVAGRSKVTSGFSTWDVVTRLYRREGVRGFWRGSLPRMANAALWGTCMVSAYEFLKRFCALEPAPQSS